MNPTGSILWIREMMNWRAALDIFLIAAVMFFLYRTLHRLGTWKIVVGIFIAVFLYVVARFLDLQGIEWVFQNVSHVAVIALIVIFQPELRKLFERAASMRGARVGEKDEGVAEIVAETVWALASQRRGAIVVFTGKESVQEWISGGHHLNADPSAPLIMSIFDPNSPGHDGALIIENGRMWKFGVRLPVSQDARLPEEYGTRHHAAMGLAEKSDALVIVVSEERGRVSLFFRGEMTAVSSPEDIVGRIYSHWHRTGSFPFEIPSGKSGQALTVQMLSSLAVAALFWAILFVSQNEMLEKVLSVPVEYTATSPDIVLVGEKPTDVRIHLAGPKSDLDALSVSEMSVKIDLSKTVEGRQTFVITEDNIRLPKTVTLVDVEPSTVELTLAAIEEHDVIVKPQLIGRLPGDLKLRSVKVRPDRIRAMSPARGRAERVESITTTPIYLDNVQADTSLYCKIIAPPSVQPVDKPWPDVQVIISVGR